MEFERKKRRINAEDTNVKSTKQMKHDSDVTSSKDKSIVKLPKGVCVKANYLRPRYNNLKEWCAHNDHLLVTRRGRIFITKKGPNGTIKEVFTYPESQWANPFKLSKYSLEKSLALYEKHLESKLQDPKVLKQFLELAKLTEIGCFCDPGSPCHRDVILKKLKEKLEQQQEKETS
jgi:hypothetical protein